MENTLVYPNIHLLAKPAGPSCNLACKYCFYLEKNDRLIQEKSRPQIMDDLTMELYVRQYIEAQEGPDINFTFQGGEPTLVGIPFYERLIDLVEKTKMSNQTVSYGLQTNGILLNDDWCTFFKKHNVLVGLSIDGPAHLHDGYRVNKKNKPTHPKVMKALGLLQHHNVEFNALTVINNKNGQHPIEVYRFLKEAGVKHMQFIPIMEQVNDDRKIMYPKRVQTENSKNFHTPEWNIDAKTFGRFLCDIYDEWVANDVGQIFVQTFELQLGFEMGLPSSLCMFAKTCGAAGIVEHNGDVYSCDHYAFEEFKLGNIHETPIRELFNSEFQIQFGQHKFDTLSKKCLKCEFLNRCYGGCPKQRVSKTPDEKVGLNRLCEGYIAFFNHIKPTMAYMADCLNHQTSPTQVMAHVSNTKTGRNNPCPCGSGKKFKRCCIVNIQ